MIRQIKNMPLPRFPPQGGQQVPEGRRGLVSVPGALQPARLRAGPGLVGRPQQDQVVDEEGQGAVRRTAWAVWFWGSSKPSCLPSRKATSSVQRRAYASRMKAAPTLTSVQKEASSRRRPAGSRTRELR